MDEDNKIFNNLQQELKRGTLVLSVLLNSSEPCYGYTLVTSLNDSGIAIEQNTLYPLLRRLEKQELLESLWDTTESRPRKYYQISKLGIEVRDKLYEEWVKTNKVIEKMAIKEN
ncbi:MAG: PadR family transcriptional regulator [Spirochaetaceae bacterium]